jgi:hypothetical protein
MLSLSVKANRTNSTLGFADTKANAQKTKRAVSCQRSTERQRKVNFIPNKLISLRKTKTS